MIADVGIFDLRTRLFSSQLTIRCSMGLRRFALVTLSLIATLPGSPVPPPVALAQSPDPCSAALAADTITAMRTPPVRARKYGRFGADTRDIRDLVQRSSAAASARSRALAATVRPAADRDENNIAILEDQGDLILRPNPFDLANRGLRFEPAGSGYTVSTVDAAFRAALGRALTLGDDDSAAQTIAFPFRFYGRSFSSLFVNSDGNLTFGEADNASTARSLGRFAAGAPRIAAFFADLDPSAGGRMFVNSAADAMTITWCAVPGFEVKQTVTAQAVLLPNGVLEFRFGATDLNDGIVGVSPGAAEAVTPIDLHPAGGQVSTAVPIGELFATTAELDLVAASRRFYQSHPDNFDQLVFWTDTTVVSDAFAFESSVKNAITGTGLEVFDSSAELGSAGTLESVINMDRITKYTAGPSQRVFGESSALGILAHETGHRWLARIHFVNADRAVSDQLLGRQRAHWSFFTDSDGSVMEGNEIEDLGGGSFRTTISTEKYSRLDLYAMGLATAAEVPRWFFIDAPISGWDREDGPISGVSITGTRRDVLIQDVIDALGPRRPAAADSPRLHRQAFVFVRRASAVQNPQDMARLANIREQFGPFFSRATENRMTVRTTLAP
jgi:hypothetical protein